MDIPTFLASFTSPPSDYRPAPFFVLNDEHEGEAGEARITKMLEDYRRIGFGGAFLHPRPGLMTEYLSPRWFALIRHAVRECRRLDLIPYLYDENSYPSGVGGGHVPSLVPEARSRYVAPTFGEDPGELPARLLALHRWEGHEPGEAVTPDELAPGQPWIAFSMGSIEPMAWHGETASPSLLDRRTIEAFLQTTHEAYQRELGDLWPNVPAIFTDEPHLTGQGHGPWDLGLHLTPYLLGEFVQRYRYDLREHLVSVFFNTGDYRAVRFDLYELMHQLWVENWARPLEAWCNERGVALTGHHLEHDWPCPYATPGHVHLLAHMHWPGTDLLETFLLAGHDDADVQNFYPAPDGQEPHGLVYLRQVHSVVNQLGKERNLDECWGAGGHDSTPADWARIGRWLIVHGVNLLNPHLSFMTIRGTRKTDHPQTFSDHSPWFDYIGPLNDELSRLAWASNQGTIEQRLLLLDPLTTGFCLSRKADSLPPDLAGSDRQIATAPPERLDFQRPLASVAGIQRDMGELAQGLSDAQADFDIGDEYVLEEFGHVDGSAVVIGDQTYRCIIWPGCLTNLRSATAHMLEQYLTGGGMLYGVRPTEVTIDGRPSSFLNQCDARFRESCRWFATRDALIQAVLKLVPPRLRFDHPPATGLAHMRRVLPTGELFVIVNSSATAIDSPIAIETNRKHLYRLDPVSGDTFTIEHGRQDGHERSGLALHPRAATFLLATDDELPNAIRPNERRRARGETNLEPIRIVRSEPNVLVLDTCELEMNGQVFEREPVYAANQRLWQTHGFESNGWFAVVQYRDQLLAQNRRMSPESGGSVTFRFDIAGDVELSTIRLAVETPELWQVSVNGRPVTFDDADAWLDVHIRAAPIGPLIRAGENVVTLEGRPFDVRREIDQIYLLGDFACGAADPGFRIEPSQALALGSWQELGLPFYDRELAYEFELPSDQPGVMSLDADGWAGSFLVVEQDGSILGRLSEFPYEIAIDPGRGRQITLRVIGLAKNLLGPFHAPGKPRNRAWPSMWYGPGVPTTPQPGADYDLIDLGLFNAPNWSTFSSPESRVE